MIKVFVPMALTVLIAILGWLCFGIFLQNREIAKISEKMSRLTQQQHQTQQQTTPSLRCEQVSSKARVFEYNGRHCSKKYSELDLVDVFEAHRFEWAMLGKTQAWWSVLSEDKYKNMKDISPERKDEFYDSSRHLQKLFAKVLEKYDLPVAERHVALDFGTGLGRLAVMAKRDLLFEKVVGIDQSFWHVETARREMTRLGYQETVQFHVSGIDLLKTLNGQQVNFVLSIIVLQHMVPPLMVAYLEQFCDALVPGGLGFVQLPTYLPKKEFNCSFDWSIQKGGMQMHALDSREVNALLLRRGCTVIETMDFDKIGVPGSKSEAFVFRKHK